MQKTITSRVLSLLLAFALCLGVFAGTGIAIPVVSDFGMITAVATRGEPASPGETEDPATPGETTNVWWIDLTANGTSNEETTTELYLDFDKEVTGLAASDIEVTGAERSELLSAPEPIAGGAIRYTLGISDITANDGDYIKVDITDPEGFEITQKSKTVAVYKEGSSKYTVTVINGTGGGEYEEGEEVTVTAKDRTSEGLEFSYWEIESDYYWFRDYYNATITFTMPDSDVTATARYTVKGFVTPPSPATVNGITAKLGYYAREGEDWLELRVNLNGTTAAAGRYTFTLRSAALGYSFTTTQSPLIPAGVNIENWLDNRSDSYETVFFAAASAEFGVTMNDWSDVYDAVQAEEFTWEQFNEFDFEFWQEYWGWTWFDEIYPRPQAGVHDFVLTATFTPSTLPSPNRPSGSGSGGGGGGGAPAQTGPSGGAVSSNVSANGSVNTAAAVNEARAALRAAGDNAGITVKNATSISPETLKQLANLAGSTGRELTLKADTTLPGGGIEARLYIDPTLFADRETDLKLGVRTTGAEVAQTKAQMEKLFDNNLAVVKFAQRGSFGATVKAAVKVDLTGLDVDNLKFYSVGADGTAREIQTAYRIDKNGFLHFSTTRAGDIIITDAPLQRK